jgi:hypothetical protein
VQRIKDAEHITDRDCRTLAEAAFAGEASAERAIQALLQNQSQVDSLPPPCAGGTCRT